MAYFYCATFYKSYVYCVSEILSDKMLSAFWLLVQKIRPYPYTLFELICKQELKGEQFNKFTNYICWSSSIHLVLGVSGVKLSKIINVQRCSEVLGAQKQLYIGPLFSVGQLPAVRGGVWNGCSTVPTPLLIYPVIIYILQ